MRSARWGLVCVAGVVVAGCDGGSVEHIGNASLSAQPSAIDFGLTWVGTPQTATITVHNDGQVSGTVQVAVLGDFTVSASSLDIPAGGNSQLVVGYAPAREGHDVGRVDMGSMHVTLAGDARVQPVCTPEVCRDVSFDPLSRSCTSRFSADGTACHTACLSGTCESGVCHGTFDSCDDGDACTTELCSEDAGCSHVPVVCPAPADPCLAAACDPATGCGTAALADGTQCGNESCTSATVHVCITGQCVLRPRVTSTRCNDTWTAPSMLSRSWQAIAYDSDRQVVVMFGGSDEHPVADTWEWDGTTWTSKHLSVAPPPGVAPMIYDSARKKMVMPVTFFDPVSFASSVQTWEYDGSSWKQIITAHLPPAVGLQGFAYDSDRKVAVLFGGVDNGYYSQIHQTWEYDGVDWYQRSPASSPSDRGATAMVYDPVKKKVLLFGGVYDTSEPNGETWEYDGSNWTQLFPDQSPPARAGHAMVYDSNRQRVILYGGNEGGDPDEVYADDTWEWDGSTWTQVSTMGAPGPRYWVVAAYDAARRQMVVHGGSDYDGDTATTWLWDGATWTSGDPAPVPPPRISAGMAYDPNRQRVVMTGGGIDSSASARFDTWEFDGTHWAQVATTGPSGRSQSTMAFDSTRDVMVLFGGQVNWTASAETWEWDGTSWAQKYPADTPSARWDHSLGYDSKRQKIVLFGGVDPLSTQTGVQADTWEYDGINWAKRSPATVPPGRHGASMIFDAARGVMVMFGGIPDVDYVAGMMPPLDDTWTWDGNDWTQLSPATSPPGRDHAAIAFDSKRLQVMMFGGVAGYSTLGDQWFWDGTNWSPHTAVGTPFGYGGAGMAYDPSRDAFVMFGGGYSGGLTSDTWLYAPP